MTRLTGIALAFVFSFSAIAQPMEASGREFVMSCTYGVLAGTLVGAATLAFEEMPGENLNKVARGASIGLYSGILLGLYVLYGVGDDDPEEYDKYIEEGLPPEEGAKLLQERLRAPEPEFRVGVAPVLGAGAIDGASATLTWNLF